MIPFDTLLPELEQAVEDRTEARSLIAMDDDDLRRVIYKLVEYHKRISGQILSDFSTRVTSAAQYHADLVDAKAFNIDMRGRFLCELLEVLQPAMASLLGPIVIDFVRGSEVIHEIFRGFQILDPWWIVSVPGKKLTDPPDDAGYAELVRTDGPIEIKRLTPQEAAEKIRDTQIPKILLGIRERLMSVAGKHVGKVTGDLWNGSDVIAAAIETMKTHPARKKP